jgi:hypothetical protein
VLLCGRLFQGRDHFRPVSASFSEAGLNSVGPPTGCLRWLGLAEQEKRYDQHQQFNQRKSRRTTKPFCKDAFSNERILEKPRPGRHTPNAVLAAPHKRLKVKNR